MRFRDLPVTNHLLGDVDLMSVDFFVFSVNSVFSGAASRHMRKHIIICGHSMTF